LVAVMVGIKRLRARIGTLSARLRQKANQVTANQVTANRMVVRMGIRMTVAQLTAGPVAVMAAGPIKHFCSMHKEIRA